MTKILITGAAGFIGSNLARYLLKDGVKPSDIRLFLYKNDSLKNLPNGVFDIVIGDIRDLSDVKKAVKDINVIYHLAAKTIVKEGSYDYYNDVNVIGTQNLLKAINKKNVKLIFFSSISVFGLPAYKGDMLNVNEDFPKKPSEGYGKTKLEAEKLIIEESKKNNFRFIIIRPTTVYGPADRAGIFQLINALKRNLFFYIGDGKNKMDYVYVEDLVRAARMAEKSNIVNEDFIIGSGNPIKQEAIVKYISKKLKKTNPSIHIPKVLALSFSVLINTLSNYLKIEPMLFPNRVKVLTADCYFSINKAKRMLSYYPKYDIKKGLEKTLNSLE